MFEVLYNVPIDKKVAYIILFLHSNIKVIKYSISHFIIIIILKYIYCVRFYCLYTYV